MVWGRPDVYETCVKDKLMQVEAWARDGLTNEQIAHNLGIATSSLYKYKLDHKEFSDALKRGKEVIDIEVENALLKRALGYEYEEMKTYIEKDDEGNEKKKVEKVKKTMAPDTTAQIFWLKNRKPKQWRDKQEINQTVTAEVTTLTREEKAEKLKALKERLNEVYDD